MPAEPPRFRVRQEDVRLSWARPARAQHLSGVGSVAAHDHAFHEIGLVLGGRGRHLARDGAHPLRPGALFVIPPDETHRIEAETPLEIVNVYYLSARLAEDLPALMAEPGVLPLLASEAGDSRRRQVLLDAPAPLVDALLRLVAAVEDPSPLMLRAAFLQVAVLAGRLWLAADPALAERMPPPGIAAEMARLDALARQGQPFDGGTGPSPDRVTRRFRAATGRTRRDYFQARRIVHACALLSVPGARVTEVAHDLGYADAAHFSRAFRARTGLTPSAWQAAYGG